MPNKSEKARNRPSTRQSKQSATTQSAAKQSATKQPSQKAASRPEARSTPPSHSPTPGLYGWITHTELSSLDPSATKAWCAKVLGWKFKPPMPMPGGDYELFTYSDKGGGGINPIKSPDVPGSVPYVHVADAQAAFDKAIREGAEAVQRPMRVMEGVTVAVVRAPGGVQIGLAGP